MPTISRSLLLAAALLKPAQADSPANAVPLTLTGSRIVNVATEPQLQTAMNQLRSGDTILLADGAYPLSRGLIINSRHNVTIRGRAGSTSVVLSGKGMDNADNGGVTVGVWSNSTNTTIAHLTIRDTYDNPIVFNAGAQAPRVYSVRLLDAGSQFIKSNPTDVNAGLGVNDGRVEYCWFEYTSRPPLDHGAGVGYFNGISAHAARNWVIRHNLFKNLNNPDGTAYPWNPAVLFWRRSTGTVTEQNSFINVDRAVAYGLDNSVPYRDHEGGVIRNNFVYLEPGFFSPKRSASADGAIIVWNSPNTRVEHNTLLLNSNTFHAIEFRFATTTNATARNNLADRGVHLRDAASGIASNNLNTARSELFKNPSTGDLHLAPNTPALDVPSVNTVTNDFDGHPRPDNRANKAGADQPTAAAPRIIEFYFAGDHPMLEFTTEIGVTYAVERATTLAPPSWSLVVFGIVGTGNLVAIADMGSSAEGARFYRVQAAL